jgi:uncharacterized protein GlcG (DUF336 family)
VHLERIDETQTSSIDVAIQKARSAAAFKRPTKVFEDGLAAGRMALLGNARLRTPASRVFCMSPVRRRWTGRRSWTTIVVSRPP